VSLAFGGNQESKDLTLQDANMLCSVTQTAITLSTGDHSFPRIDAHIYIKSFGLNSDAGNHGVLDKFLTCPLEYTC